MSHSRGTPRSRQADMPPIHQPNELQILITILTPNEGHYYHWMIVLYDTSPFAHPRWHVYEAARSRPGGWFDVRKTNEDPREHPGCRTPLVLVARVEGAKLEEVKEAFEAVKASREDPHWDCQSYVDEVLGELKERGFMSEEERRRALEELAPYRGRMAVAFEDRPRVRQRRLSYPLSAEFVEDSESGEE